jgi:hypothetical protein
VEFRSEGKTSEIHRHLQIHVSILHHDNNSLVVFMVIVSNILLLHVSLKRDLFLFMMGDATLGSLAKFLDVSFVSLLDKDAKRDTCVLGHIVLLIELEIKQVALSYYQSGMVEALVDETLVYISISHSDWFIGSICEDNIFNLFAVGYQKNSIFLGLKCDIVRLSKGNLILRKTQVVDIRAALA